MEQLYSNPKFFRTLEEKLAKAQRIMSRRTIGGANWYKAKIKVARIHEKITNARNDYLAQNLYRDCQKPRHYRDGRFVSI